MSKEKTVTGVCKISGETFCVNEINGLGYSNFHWAKYSKMRLYAKSRLNRRFGLRDYREMHGFPNPTSNRGLKAEEIQKLEVWAASKVI